VLNEKILCVAFTLQNSQRWLLIDIFFCIEHKISRKMLHFVLDSWQKSLHARFKFRVLLLRLIGCDYIRKGILRKAWSWAEFLRPIHSLFTHWNIHFDYDFIAIVSTQTHSSNRLLKIKVFWTTWIELRWRTIYRPSRTCCALASPPRELLSIHLTWIASYLGIGIYS
jgi:hypothetical protein